MREMRNSALSVQYAVSNTFTRLDFDKNQIVISRVKQGQSVAKMRQRV